MHDQQDQQVYQQQKQLQQQPRDPAKPTTELGICHAQPFRFQESPSNLAYSRLKAYIACRMPPELDIRLILQ